MEREENKQLNLPCTARSRGWVRTLVAERKGEGASIVPETKMKAARVVRWTASHWVKEGLVFFYIVSLRNWWRPSTQPSQKKTSFIFLIWKERHGGRQMADFLWPRIADQKARIKDLVWIIWSGVATLVGVFGQKDKNVLISLIFKTGLLKKSKYLPRGFPLCASEGFWVKFEMPDRWELGTLLSIIVSGSTAACGVLKYFTLLPRVCWEGNFYAGPRLCIFMGCARTFYTLYIHAFLTLFYFSVSYFWFWNFYVQYLRVWLTLDTCARTVHGGRFFQELNLNGWRSAKGQSWSLRFFH